MPSSPCDLVVITGLALNQPLQDVFDFTKGQAPEPFAVLTGAYPSRLQRKPVYAFAAFLGSAFFCSPSAGNAKEMHSEILAITVGRPAS